MVTYKLVNKRMVNGKPHYYPLYVNAKAEMETGVWLTAEPGELVDETHVKASGCGGKLSLCPGFHSTLTPFCDWIGKRVNGILVQRKNTVWVECRVIGKQFFCNHSRELLDGWYYRRTNAKQKDPWVVSKYLMIVRELTRAEVEQKCRENGLVAQRMEG